MSAVAWIIPTVSDMENGLIARAINDVRTKGLGTGQADPFDESMEAITSRIRAEIAHNQTISLTENAIPPSLMWVAKLLIVEQLVTRLPNISKALIEDQAEQRADARKYLERINRGDIEVEYPTDPMTDPLIQEENHAEVVTTRTYVATRELLAGL